MFDEILQEGSSKFFTDVILPMLAVDAAYILGISSLKVGSEMYNLIKYLEENGNRVMGFLKRIGICNKCLTKGGEAPALCYHEVYKDPQWKPRARTQGLFELMKAFGKEKEYWAENWSMGAVSMSKPFNPDRIIWVFDKNHWYNPEEVTRKRLDFISIGIDTSEGGSDYVMTAIGYYPTFISAVSLFFLQSSFIFILCVCHLLHCVKNNVSFKNSNIATVLLIVQFSGNSLTNFMTIESSGDDAFMYSNLEWSVSLWNCKSRVVPSNDISLSGMAMVLAFS